jgi:23S rRNA (adenine1618-N6)-methyltransferase
VGSLHPRNAFKGSYDMDRLVAAHPALRNHIIPAASSKSGRATINFADAAAVRAINAALLKDQYGIDQWEQFLPDGRLVPPVPGRADYLHHVSLPIPTTHARVRRAAMCVRPTEIHGCTVS